MTKAYDTLYDVFTDCDQWLTRRDLALLLGRPSGLLNTSGTVALFKLERNGVINIRLLKFGQWQRYEYRRK